MRTGKFQKGSNSWNYFKDKAREKRISSLSSRMKSQNPMKDEVNRFNKHKSQQTGRAKHITSYLRNKIIRERKICSMCSIDFPLLVHHIDKNPSNNKESNLLVVCHNCHYVVHNGEKK